MAAPPSYIDLLNAIVQNERGNARLFASWAHHTTTPHVRAMLEVVAGREAEHAQVFAERVEALGGEVVEHVRTSLKEQLEVAASDAPDREKFERLGYGAPRPDPFSTYFDDASIDAVTGALLGRFIAEERDSARLIDACYASISAAP
jgi:hypothetical protein